MGPTASSTSPLARMPSRPTPKPWPIPSEAARINRDGSIPTDNPFYGSTSGINRSIWASGLRNPFTFAFQSSTGRLFINDVGAGTWEEINDGIAGSNYGWPASEGPTSTPDSAGPVRLWPWQRPGWRVRDRRRRFLQPRRHPVPGVLRRELLLRRPGAPARSIGSSPPTAMRSAPSRQGSTRRSTCRST